MAYKKASNIAAWALFVFMLVFTSLHLYKEIYSPEKATTKDFSAFWSAAKISTRGTPELAYNTKAMKAVIATESKPSVEFTWIYPPTFQSLIYPLGYTSYLTAFTIFTCISILAVLILLKKFCPPRYWIFILSSPAIFIAIGFGQNSIITAALGLASILLMPTSPKVSGIAMGLLSLKPHLFFFLPIFAAIEKKWQTIFTAAATAISLIAYSVYLLGIKPWQSFFYNLERSSTWLQDGTLATDLMTSIAANLLLFQYSFKFSITLHLLNLALLVISAIKIFKQKKDFNLRAAAAIIVSINISPYMFTYELTWLSIALILLLKLESWSRMQKIMIYIFWLFPLLDLTLNTILVKSFSLTFIVSHLIMLIIIYKKNQHETL